MAIGSKMYRPSRAAYFSALREAASSAAAPDSRAAAMIHESANGQIIVTSQHSALPLEQGTSVRPSGRLLSDLNRPDGSLVTGKPAEESPDDQIIESVLSGCFSRNSFTDKAVDPTGVHPRATMAFMWNAQVQP